MKKRFIAGLIMLMVWLMAGCEVNYQISDTGFKEKEWELVEKSGSKTTVNLYVYDAEQPVVDWLGSTVKDAVYDAYSIRLNVMHATYPEIVAMLKKDQTEEIKQGELDLIYLSQSEDFKNLSDASLLYGPFLGSIKAYALQGNQTAVESTTIEGHPHMGFAVPVWKKAMYLIGNEDFLLDLPESYEGFIEAIQNNPNTFTFAPEDALGGKFLRGFVMRQVGYNAILKTTSKEDLRKLLEPSFAELNTLKKNFHGEGKKFPGTDAEVDRLFIDNQLAFSMSDVFEHIYDEQKKEAYPEGAKPFNVEGLLPYTPAYMVIPFNAGNKSGALLTLQTILSPKLQASLLVQKGPSRIPVINMDLLSADEKSLILKATAKKTIPKGEDLMQSSIADLPQVKWAVISSLWNDYLKQHP